jgi:hypothetical protein
VVGCLAIVLSLVLYWVIRRRRRGDAHEPLHLKELGIPQHNKFKSKPANLSICLDIEDSDDDDAIETLQSKPAAIRTPTIAGTFVEEDANMFRSDVFS